MRRLYLALFLFYPFFAFSQKPSENESIIQEGLILLNYIQEDLYENHILLAQKDSLQEAFQEAFRQINSRDSTVNTKELFIILSKVFTSIQDGHTTIFDLNYNSFDGLLFPYDILVYENKLFIKENFNCSQLKKGDEIISINNTPTSKFLEEMSKLTFYEDERVIPKIVQKRFPYFLWLLSKENCPAFDIQYKPYGKDEILNIIISQPLDQTLINKSTKDHIIHKLNNSAELYRISSNTVCLKIMNFNDTEKSFKKFMQQCTHYLNHHTNYENIIIDIRGNPGGGINNAFTVLKYFIPNNQSLELSIRHYSGPLLNMSFKKINIVRKMKAYLSRAKYKPMNGRKQFTTHLYRFKGVKEKVLIEGNIFLLTNEETFSSAGIFADYFKAYNIGITYGKHHVNYKLTGGTFYQTFKNLNFRYYIPSLKFIYPEKLRLCEPPDQIIDCSLEEQIFKADCIMDKILEIIE
ncbi:MAG: S41 family peptidase [Cytophagaceae bacterium]